MFGESTLLFIILLGIQIFIAQGNPVTPAGQRIESVSEDPQRTTLQENPCNLIDCRDGFYCVIGPRNCNGSLSDEPSPRCVPLGPCAAVRCRGGYCINTPSRPLCVPSTDPCANVKCDEGYHCSRNTRYCFTTPCPQPPPTCEPIKKTSCDS